MKKIKNKFFLIMFFIFIILHLFLILNQRIYPFVDMPSHLAAATIFRYYNEPTNQFEKYYSIDMFPKPNIFYILFCSLKIFPSVEFANKIFLCIYAILLPLSVLLIIKKMKGNLWFSLLSFLFLYNFNLGWGFVNFIISIPFILLFIYFLIDYHHKKDIKGKVILTVFFLFLFLLHALAALFSLLIFFLYSLYYFRNSITKLIEENIVVIPSLIFIVIWRISEFDGQSTLKFLFEYYKKEYFAQLLFRFVELMSFDTYYYLENKIALIFSFFIIIFFLAGIVYQKNLAKHIKKFFLPYLFFISSVFCFFFLPHGTNNVWFIYHRFSVFIFISIIIIISIIYSKNFNKIIIFLICLICMFHFVLNLDYFTAFQIDSQSFTKNIFPDDDKKLAGLIYDNSFSDRPVYIHFPNYYIIWAKRIATTCIIDYRFFTIRRKVADDILPYYDEWVVERGYDGRYQDMDYILVRGEIPETAMPYLENFTLNKSIDKWSLLKNTRE